jgi:hypothetical protein
MLDLSDFPLKCLFPWRVAFQGTAPSLENWKALDSPREPGTLDAQVSVFPIAFVSTKRRHHELLVSDTTREVVHGNVL